MGVISANRKSVKAGLRQYVDARREGAEDTPTCERPYQFLAQKITTKRDQALEGLKAFQELDLDREKCISYLNQCAEAFAKARHLSFKPCKAKKLTINIRHVYNFVWKNLPEGRILNLDYVQERGVLMLFESEQVEFPSDEVFYMPIVCLDYFEGALRELMLHLFHLLHAKQGFCVPKNNWYFMYALNQSEDEAIEEREEEEHCQLYYSYRNGHVSQLMDEIESHELKDDIEALIWMAMIQPSIAKHKGELIDCAERGIKLLHERRLCNMDYVPERSLCYNLDGDDCGERLCFEQICSLSYGTIENDEIADASLDEINQDAWNIGEFVMYDVHPITPEDAGEWTPTDFPSRFYKWYHEMYDLISNYEPKQDN